MKFKLLTIPHCDIFWDWNLRSMRRSSSLHSYHGPCYYQRGHSFLLPVWYSEQILGTYPAMNDKVITITKRCWSSFWVWNLVLFCASHFAGLINRTKSGEVDSSLAGRLGYLANSLARIIETSDLEKRISDKINRFHPSFSADRQINDAEYRKWKKSGQDQFVRSENLSEMFYRRKSIWPYDEKEHHHSSESWKRNRFFRGIIGHDGKPFGRYRNTKQVLVIIRQFMV